MPLPPPRAEMLSTLGEGDVISQASFPGGASDVDETPPFRAAAARIDARSRRAGRRGQRASRAGWSSR